MIELIAAAKSAAQAEALLETGIDVLYLGEDDFGLRLPGAFTPAEIIKVTKMAHQYGSKICVAVNAFINSDEVTPMKKYLAFLAGAGIDRVLVGDPAIMHVLNHHKEIKLSYWYDGTTTVTNARQVNFWARRGASGVVLSREIPFEELKFIQSETHVPVEIQVYGAACMHYSRKRPGNNNWYDPAGTDMFLNKGIQLADLKYAASHYSIYEDKHGIHLFAASDLNLLPYLDVLAAAGLTNWKLESKFIGDKNYLAAVRIFTEARQALLEGKWSIQLKNKLNKDLLKIHPGERPTGPGDFLKKTDKVI